MDYPIPVHLLRLKTQFHTSFFSLFELIGVFFQASGVKNCPALTMCVRSIHRGGESDAGVVHHRDEEMPSSRYHSDTFAMATLSKSLTV